MCRKHFIFLFCLEPRLIKFKGRKMLCHPDFRLYLSSARYNPKFSPTLASTTTLVNFGSSNETVFEDLLDRSFAILHRELYAEKCKIENSLKVNTVALTEIKSHFNKTFLLTADDRRNLTSELELREMSEYLRCTEVVKLSLKNVSFFLNPFLIHTFAI